MPMAPESLLRPLTRGFVPFMQAVTFFPRAAPGGPQFDPAAGYSLYRANRDEQTKARIDPALRSESEAWELWLEELTHVGAPIPKISDVIVDDDGIRWTVMKVTTSDQQQSYICECKRERKAGQAE